MFFHTAIELSRLQGLDESMKCDLHLHTWYSGMCSVPVVNRVCRECYTDAGEAYDKLKRLGMGLVTVTDHDSIGSAEILGRHSDFFLSEEVTLTLPGGTEAHVGVYDITERQHVRLQQLRHDGEAFLAYVEQQRLFFSINHVFSSLTGPRTEADFALFLDRFPGMETRNAAMLAMANRAAERLAARWRKAPVGGSDAHALRSVGRAYTEVPGARNKEEFLAGLRAGRGIVRGGDGSYPLLMAEVVSIARSLVADMPAMAFALPLLASLPLILTGNYFREIVFAQHWMRKLDGASAHTVRPRHAEGVA